MRTVAVTTIAAATTAAVVTTAAAAIPDVAQTAHVMTGEMIVIITVLLSQAVTDRSCRLRQCQDRSQGAFIIFREQQAVVVKSN